MHQHLALHNLPDKVTPCREDQHHHLMCPSLHPVSHIPLVPWPTPSVSQPWLVCAQVCIWRSPVCARCDFTSAQFFLALAGPVCTWSSPICAWSSPVFAWCDLTLVFQSLPCVSHVQPRVFQPQPSQSKHLPSLTPLSPDESQPLLSLFHPQGHHHHLQVITLVLPGPDHQV